MSGCLKGLRTDVLCLLSEELSCSAVSPVLSPEIARQHEKAKTTDSNYYSNVMGPVQSKPVYFGPVSESIFPSPDVPVCVCVCASVMRTLLGCT